jgi:hypothetical protein
MISHRLIDLPAYAIQIFGQRLEQTFSVMINKEDERIEGYVAPTAGLQEDHLLTGLALLHMAGSPSSLAHLT